MSGEAFGGTEPRRPEFAETACDLPGISPEIAPRLRCGTVSVPRDYEHPDAGSFRLAVVVVRSARQPPLPDPVVYISGGPGSPLTIYTEYQSRHPYAQDRDLILVDQRAIGRSEPAICPNVTGKLLAANLAVAANPTGDERARRRRAYMACHDQAIAEGLDLDDFGTPVTVEDFERVRQALGIERWNVVGESYGTTVAMTLMARHPDTLRSAVLDSVYPPDPISPIWSARVAKAEAAFFAMCDQDTACAAAFPSLAGLYQEALDRLGSKPLIVSVPPRMRQPNDQVLLTASLFKFIVGHLTYYPNNYPALPRLIAAVRDGGIDDLGTVLVTMAAEGEALNIPAYVSVECRDRPHYRDPLPDGADALDETSLHGICDDWSDLGPPPVIPGGTEIPTIVLAGQFDPNADPSLSRHVADVIGGHARWIEFSLIGHNVTHFSSCGMRIVADFVDQPARAPDTSCAGQAAPIRFLPGYPAP